MKTDRRFPTERGGVALLAVVGILAMCFIGALSIDIGVGYHEKRKVRSLAQAAVLAAAQETELTDNGTKLDSVAKAFAEREGYKHNFEYRDPSSGVPNQACSFSSGDENCVSVVTETVSAATYPTALPAGGYRVIIKRNSPTTFAALFGRQTVPVEGRAVAGVRRAPMAVHQLMQSRRKGLSITGKSVIKLTSAALIQVNSVKPDALSVGGSAQLDTYVQPRVHGLASVSATSSQWASAEPGAAGIPGPGKKAAIEGAPCLWDPFRLANDAKGCTCDTGCEPAGQTPPRPIPEIKPGGLFADPSLNFTVQCGGTDGPDDNKALLLYDGAGYPRQNSIGMETFPGEDFKYSLDPSQWKLSKQLPTDSGGDPGNGSYCPGLAKTTGGYQTVDSLLDYTYDAEGEFVLCPGIYAGGVRIRNTRVRFATCADPLCAGKCPGAEATNPVFIFAAGGLKVTTTRKGVPPPPYGKGELSATRVRALGVTLIQTKHQSGGYARISIDKNSDLKLTPPPMTSSSVFKGISMYVDRDYRKGVQISGRALAGPFGGISGDIYAPFANVVIRGGSKNTAELATPIKAAFIAGTVRFGGQLNDSCDAADPDDDCSDGCDETCAGITDATELADCMDACAVEAALDEDPEGVFAPEDGGASATRIVLAPAVS